MQPLSRKVTRRFLQRCLSTKAAATTEAVDVLIVGGGVVGTGMAAVLQRTLPHLSVRVLEAGSSKTAPSTPSPIPHPRSYALSPASLQFLQLHDDKSSSSSKHLGYYKSMQVWEARQPAFLNFGVEDLPHTINGEEWLGAVTEDSFLVQELSSRLTPDTIQYDTTVSALRVPSHAAKGLAHVQLKHNNSTTETSTLECQLVVAADGANSPIRHMLGIPSRVHEYGETALTFTVEIDESSMQQRAFQRFCGDEGILALLPTRSDRHAIVVWSTSPEQVAHWKNVSFSSPSLLMEHLNSLLQRGPERLDPLLPTATSVSEIPILSNLQYGAEKVWEMIQYGSTLAGHPTHSFQSPPRLLDSASPLLSFPLQLRQVSRYTAPRVALVGDAAHTVHPMAGQGLNLGLQDVQCLVEQVEKADQAGMDLATFVEDGYERSRQQQVMVTVQGIHALHQVFRNQSPVIKHLKTVGINLVQNVKPVRSLLVQAACGGVGNNR